jgi:hypothetical protein
MLFLQPSPTELLALAAEVIGRSDPHERADMRRGDMMLAGRAASIAVRELFSGRDVEHATACDVSRFYRDAQTSLTQGRDVDLASLWSQLAQDIRSGQFDDEALSPSVHGLLTTIAQRCLEVTNPRYAKQLRVQFGATDETITNTKSE